MKGGRIGDRDLHVRLADVALAGRASMKGGRDHRLGRMVDPDGLP
jgi:hypothetical protein